MFYWLILISVMNHIWVSQVVPVVKNPLTIAGDGRDMGLIPGSGKSSGGGNGNAFQSSYLGYPMAGGAWWATVPRVAKSQTRLKQSNPAHTHAW